MTEYNKTDRTLVDRVIFQTNRTGYANAVFMTFVAAVIWPIFDPMMVGIWLLTGVILVIIRGFIFIRIIDGRLLQENYLWRERSVAIALALSGTHWGIAGWLFMDPKNVATYAFLTASNLGVAATIIASTSPRPKLWLAFGATEFTIIGAKFISLGFTLLAIMTAVFTIGVYLVTKSVGEQIKISVNKDFLNEELLKEVSIAKDLAEKANIEKSQFMAATSHDLRQPLHAQGLLLEALKGKSTPDDNLVEKLVASNAVLHGLFDSLLEISQLDSGTIKVNESHQPIHDICMQVINDFEHLATDKKLALTLTGEKCIVLTDPILLGRIIRNLVSNAIKYTNKGYVNIDIAKQGENVVLTVKDTGIGIASEEHKAIFNEYTQLNNNARDRHKGVGLGLALVRRMCALLEHEVSIESTLGEGASFTLLLPLGDATKVITARETSSPVLVKDLDIVLVDDEQAILDAMQVLLSQWECRCHAFATVEEAEQSISSGDYTVDIIISDYRLGDDVTGLECIKRLRQVTGLQTIAVLLSGDTDPKLLKQVQDAGFYMLHKPLKPTKLRNLMGILLDAKH